MKILIRFLLLLLAVTCNSCSTDSEDEPSSYLYINPSGMLNIQVADYESGGIDSIRIYDDGALLGRCKLTTDGKVMMQLSKPGLSKIGGIKDIQISDTTAQVKTLTTLNAYNADNTLIGTISCNNVINNEYISVGDEVGKLMYCDRDLVIKGTKKNATKIITSTNETLDYTYITTFNETLKKGWNVIVCKVEVSRDSTGAVYQTTYSTTIPADLSWKFTTI